MLCGYIGEKFLGVGVWISRRFMLFGMLQFYFTQDIFGDIGLKPTAASKQKSKAAAENTPVNVVRDRIIAVLIFQSLQCSSGLRLNRLEVR
jgi:POT family proton-dependent oligopeptide transporter